MTEMSVRQWQERFRAGIFPQRIVLFNVRPGGMTGSVRMTPWPDGSRN